MPHPIDQIITDLAAILLAREWKVITAESCTGGGVAYALTERAGSSDWFERGLVTYSNAAKAELLAVSQHTLQAFGAVSEQTARAMASGALAHARAQVSVAITGIAGPGGGTIDKPVGTVWFAWAAIDREIESKMVMLSGDRTAIRQQSIHIALEKLLAYLQAK